MKPGSESDLEGAASKLSRRLDRFMLSAALMMLGVLIPLAVALYAPVGNTSWLAAVLLGGLLAYAAIIKLQFIPLRRAMRDWQSDLTVAQTRAHHAMMTDQLTGLPTRLQLKQDIAELLGNRHALPQPVALLHIDIARFREVNEVFGRDLADRVLLRVSQILTLSAGPGDLVARIAPDEFCVTTFGEETTAEKIASDLHALMRIPVDIDGERIALDCVIGIAVDNGTLDADGLLGNAELALNMTKTEEGGDIRLYTEDMRTRQSDRQFVAQGLSLALSHDQIEPFFQPQIDAKTGRVVGFEALVRWRHPRRGILRPRDFLQVAADTNLIADISKVMIAKSFSTLSYWRRLGLDVPQISLNFTATELRKPSFVDMLMFDIDRAGLDPADVCVELLETSLIVDEDDPVIDTLSRLTELGVQVELDDFGTGHASISNLQRIHVNGMKIARDFIRQVDANEEQQKLTHAMLSLAGSLRIGSLAEGVETEAERDMLVAMGCERLQGFGIGMPMAAEDATAWLRNYQRGNESLATPQTA